MIYSLTVEKRQGGDAMELRANSKIPAVVYGPEIEPVNIVIGYNDFQKLYNEAGESSLIDMSISGNKEPLKVLVQDVQYDPIKNRITHADFRQISMNKEMEVPVEINFVGESKAVKELGGTLFRGLETVTVKCLPKDLVGSIDVDITQLNSFSDVIHTKDLVLPAGIKLADGDDLVVVKVTAPLTEEQIKAMEEAGPKSIEDVKVEEKKKEEPVEEEKK